LKRTPWGWLPEPDRLRHFPGRPGPEGEVTMMIERVSQTEFRFYHKAENELVLMGAGERPEAEGLESCELYVGGYSTAASAESHFFARDLRVSKRQLEAAEQNPFALASELAAVERHILLPATLVQVESESTRKYRFTFRTPSYQQDSALLFFGLNQAADDSGDGGMTWRLLNGDDEEIWTGYKKNKSWWRWMAVLPEPETTYSFEVSDLDTTFSGTYPGNGAFAGAYLAVYGEKAPLRVSERMSTMAEPGAGWIDVMPLIDPERDSLGGKWELAEDGLRQLDAGRGRQMLRLPICAGDAYELEFSFTRLSGDGPINVRFPVGNRHPGLALDGPADGARNSAIFHVRDLGANPTVVKSEALAIGERHRLALRVKVDQVDVSIVAELDGKTLTAWEGDIEKLARGQSNAVPHFSRSMAIGIRGGAMAIHDLRLRGE
jgi:hypothetical protein